MLLSWIAWWIWYQPRQLIAPGFDLLWPCDTVWWHRSGSVLAQVMACHLMAPSHYLINVDFSSKVFCGIMNLICDMSLEITLSKVLNTTFLRANESIWYAAFESCESKKVPPWLRTVSRLQGFQAVDFNGLHLRPLKWWWNSLGGNTFPFHEEEDGLCLVIGFVRRKLNSLWPSAAIWWQRSQI